MAKAKKVIVETESKLKKVVGIVPVGNQVLVERLLESELSETALYTGNDKSSNQGIILAIGPLVSENYGLKVGQRVWLVGTSSGISSFDDSKREKNLCLPDLIKAVLVEAE